LPPPLRYDLVRAMYRKAAIRPYRVDDEPLLFGLASRVFGEMPGWHDRRILDVLESDVVFVAEVEGTMAGYEALERAEVAVRIEQLLVCPEHDDEGVGEQLLAYAEGYAISLGAPRLEAVVEPENVTAFAFYRERGFVPAGPDLLELVLPQR